MDFFVCLNNLLTNNFYIKYYNNCIFLSLKNIKINLLINFLKFCYKISKIYFNLDVKKIVFFVLSCYIHL